VLGLSRLAENLLAPAQSDAGPALEHTAEIDLCDVVQRVVARYAGVAAERQVHIDVRGDRALTSGDARVLSRVISNLLENALKFSPAGGRIAIDVANGTDASVTVRDQGPGVPADHVPHLFTRFFRGNPARPRAEGTGLGLAIAKAGAEAHGGRIEFIGNEPGAVFRLTLPSTPPNGSSSPTHAPTQREDIDA
jgi:signal transduction histidine kinase